MGETPLLVIFGAGASYDSIGKYAGSVGPWVVERPPLGRELFGDRFDVQVQSHERCGPLVAHLRAMPSTTNLEAELERIQAEEAPTSALRRAELMALRYYLRDVLARVVTYERHAPAQTNYHLLLEQLVLWQERTGSRITLVTFNYDTMIENALRSVTGRRLGNPADYASTDALQLFKPHGSTNWGRVSGNDFDSSLGATPAAAETQVIALAAAETLTLGDEFHVIDTRGQGVAGQKLLVPALTVPVQDKGSFEFPEAHRAALAEALSSESGPLKVLTIGWRAGERHFLDLWRDHRGPTQPQLLTVNGTDAGSIKTVGALREAGLRFVGVRALEGGFSQVLGQPLQQFLDARLGGYPYEVG